MSRAETVGTQDSKSTAGNSGRYRKHLQGFFGEDHLDEEPGGLYRERSVSPRDTSGSSRRKSSGARHPPGSAHYGRHTEPYLITDRDGRVSPKDASSSSRLHTPLPNSEVIPWEYQKFAVSWDLFSAM